MMRVIGHFLATLLAAALSLTIFLWTLGVTLANPAYLENQADATQLYTGLAAAIPGSQASSIRSQVETLLPQFISYLTTNSTPPSADFGAGQVALTIPDPRVATTLQLIHQIGIIAPITAAVLILMIIVLTGRSRLPNLARACFGAAISLGISAGLLWLSPNFILQSLNKSDVIPIRSAITTFLNGVFHDIASHLLIAAAVLVVIAIVLRLAHSLINLKSRFTKPSEPTQLQPPTGSSN